MKSILDPTFLYTPSVKTDLRKTFARIRREQRRQVEVEAKVEAQCKVSSIVRRPKLAVHS